MAPLDWNFPSIRFWGFWLLRDTKEHILIFYYCILFMPEKGYIIKNGKVIITDRSAKIIRTLRENGSVNLDFTFNRLQEILLPKSAVLDPIESDAVYETIMDIAANSNSIEKYVERIKDPEKEATKKLRPYF